MGLFGKGKEGKWEQVKAEPGCYIKSKGEECIKISFIKGNSDGLYEVSIISKKGRDVSRDERQIIFYEQNYKKLSDENLNTIYDACSKENMIKSYSTYLSDWGCRAMWISKEEALKEAEELYDTGYLKYAGVLNEKGECHFEYTDESNSQYNKARKTVLENENEKLKYKIEKLEEENRKLIKKLEKTRKNSEPAKVTEGKTEQPDTKLAGIEQAGD